ncbi:MAG: hypothetical protein NTX76_01595 [Alphaproteobacteria bacterium]|nr:hypothetical protein [Alphaproteobacteria bacterium]
MKKSSLIFILLLGIQGVIGGALPTQPPVHTHSDGSIQDTYLTIYKDASLLRQIRSLSAQTGEHTYHISPIAQTIFPNTLMIGSAIDKQNIPIKEYTLIPENGYTSALNLTLNSSDNHTNHLLQLLYMFKDLTWQVYYTIELSPSYNTVNINSWIIITNNTHLNFNKSHVQLVDGAAPVFLFQSKEAKGACLPHSQYAYSINQLTNIPAHSVKQINWASSHDIEVRRSYHLAVGGVYLEEVKGRPHPMVETWISFANNPNNGLGLWFPPGEAVFYSRDEKGFLEMLGKVSIPHTPVGKDVELLIPSHQSEKNFSHDDRDSMCKIIETELDQTEYKKLTDKMSEESFRLNLRNRSDQPIAIQVVLDTPEKTEITIVRENTSHQQTQTGIHWTVHIGPNADVDLKYRIRIIKL